MKCCPKCDCETRAGTLPDGEVAWYCPECGWGRDRFQKKDHAGGGRHTAAQSIPAITWLKLPVSWVLSLLIIIDPYLTIIYSILWLIENQCWNFIDISREKLIGVLNPAYWIITGIYLLLAVVLSPTYDPDNLGMFGKRWIDNPFSYEDDYNRLMQNFAILLLPG